MPDQFSTTAALEARIALHTRFSRNKTPFNGWILSHFDLRPGMKILDAGCGTGVLWRDAQLPEDVSLTLCDLSPAMAEAARRNSLHHPRVRCDVADITALPYPDGTFDLVAANMVLQFVPDVQRALGELRRVLKSGGRFCCVALGEYGYNDALMDMLGQTWRHTWHFTTQNAPQLLTAVFGDVTLHPRDDALDVDDLSALSAYIRTMPMLNQSAFPDDASILARLASHIINGTVTLPKEYCLYTARRAN